MLTTHKGAEFVHELLTLYILKGIISHSLHELSTYYLESYCLQ